MGNIGNYVQSTLPDNILREILVDGIIAGVGAIVIFLPQILLLMFFMLYRDLPLKNVGSMLLPSICRDGLSIEENTIY